ncbi:MULTISPECIES: oxygen-insensitive NADPH nitroreductase [unclassified Paenibacillus]|uniref:oxygen-insensitive NADPH nitroreductase n=1 Tax=unclassified Paenibacillus TaxID=185978 RepID=UPI001AE7A732|nr:MULTISPECIES: oxygen-insensitive NADPH nitroreductase [unclassified Paenibacillus]MBP1156921.1 FMN reductase (NADPH) [Paenibacillus sp. PvP091]MBP1172340.1 FMN reductase (NADPH) [Paenibacillus sp. PvR098]MBP2438721.1 FMN reductase (NADPH) [Paenibacillus sp. PvP052]
MNETIEMIMKHRSIRKFKKDPVSKDQLVTIVRAAQMASTSSNVQAYSVIHVSDRGKRSQLAALAGDQAYVEECPVFLVWCADLYRLKTTCGFDEGDGYIGTTENLIVAVTDVALAAQNAAVAAESMGLGVVYIGGIRNNSKAVSVLLQLPEYVIPVYGMCIGYPDQSPAIRPRLPYEAVLHEDVYSEDHYKSSIQAYDAVMKQYMLDRTDGKRDTNWTQAMQAKLGAPARMHMKDFLSSQRFWDDEKASAGKDE